MIEGTAKRDWGIDLTRADIYICNLVKCRRLENRTPEPDEMEICGQFLYRQFSAIRPRRSARLAAARTPTGREEALPEMHGKWFARRDIPAMVTYHSSYLLHPYSRQPAQHEAWEDLKKLLDLAYH